jgi:hypothetical protein
MEVSLLFCVRKLHRLPSKINLISPTKQVFRNIIGIPHLAENMPLFEYNFVHEIYILYQRTKKKCPYYLF